MQVKALSVFCKYKWVSWGLTKDTVYLHSGKREETTLKLTIKNKQEYIDWTGEL